MKYLKLIFATLTIALLFNCNIKTESNSNAPRPDFKIGKKGVEKILKQEFKFEKLSFGTSMMTKMGVKELGLNLKFQKGNVNSESDSLLKEYSKVIKKTVVKNLLHLEDYDFINITFENEKVNGEFTKSTAVKIKEQLK